MFKTLKQKVGLICYTSKHWFYYQKLAIKLKVWHPRHLLHDVDKLFLYVFYDKNIVTNLHRNTTSHHVDFKAVGTLSNNTIIDAIIDWECARFTKPDKPLTARETLKKYYPNHTAQILPMLNLLGL